MAKLKVYKSRKSAKARFYNVKEKFEILPEFIPKLKTRLLRCIGCRRKIHLPCVGQYVKVVCECDYTFQIWSPET